MSFGLAVQKAIFDKLKASVALMAEVSDVLDAVDEFQDFPYVTIGEDVISEWDTVSTTGGDGVITIHTWSRYTGSNIDRSARP